MEFGKTTLFAPLDRYGGPPVGPFRYMIRYSIRDDAGRDALVAWARRRGDVFVAVGDERASRRHVHIYLESVHERSKADDNILRKTGSVGKHILRDPGPGGDKGYFTAATETRARATSYVSKENVVYTSHPAYDWRQDRSDEVLSADRADDPNVYDDPNGSDDPNVPARKKPRTNWNEKLLEYWAAAGSPTTYSDIVDFVIQCPHLRWQHHHPSLMRKMAMFILAKANPQEHYLRMRERIEALDEADNRNVEAMDCKINFPFEE